jgi:hypothetical protein
VNTTLRLCLVLTVASVSWLPVHAVDYHRVLLPISASLGGRNLPGAHGSEWRVDAWIHYTGTEPVAIVPRPFICIITCDPWFVMQPHRPPLGVNAGGPTEPGFFFHIPKEYASEFVFHLRVRDFARHPDSQGTSVPVISEEKFGAAVHLLNVPTGPNARVHVRIYGLPEAENRAVLVRYLRVDEHWELGPPILLREDVVQLSFEPPPFGLLFRPSFAMLPNVELLPELAGEEAVWIEIVAASPELRIWAMASITDNASQLVTIVAPEP